MKVVIIDPSCFTMPYDHCLCNALSHRGCEVYFIGSRYLYGKWEYSADYQRINHFYRFTNWLYNRPNGIFRKEVKGVEHFIDMFSLINRLQHLRPSVIHFQWLPLPLIDSPYVARLRKIAPVILTIHDIHPFNEAPSSIIQKYYYTSAIKYFDHLITHTNSSFEALVSNMKIPKEKISIVPHGIFDYSQQSKISTRKEEGKKNIIVFWGAIKPYKGVDILIQAFANLPENILQKTTLLIAGCPKMDIKPLKKMAQNLGVIDYIEWQTRFIPEDEVNSILIRATVFVLPYKEITQSGVLMTILPFGKPIVASNVGGIPEVLQDGIHGYLVTPNNSIELSRALEAILTSPQKIRNMSSAVHQLTKSSLSWNSIAQKTIKVYQGLLKRGTSPQG